MPLGDSPPEPGALQGRRRLTGAFLIDVSRIRPDPLQPRRLHDDGRQQELNESVRRLGILQPISVRYDADVDVYFVLAGERRFRAAIATGLVEIPCWVQSPKEEEVLVHQIVENWQRADLHPFDLADALMRIRDAHGYTQRDLSNLTGKPESEISRHLALLKLAPEVQKAARTDRSGDISRRHLLAIVHANPATQEHVFRIVREKGLTALETEQFVREENSKTVAMPPRGAPRAMTRHFHTSRAVVILRFRHRNVTDSDVLTALDEARQTLTKDGA